MDEKRNQINNLKEFYKNKKNDDNEEDTKPMTFLKKILPFIISFGIFFIVIYFIIFIVDGYLAPSLIHSRREMKIPLLEGMELDKAINSLEKRGLKYEISKKQFDRNAPENTIIKQFPEAGKKVKENRPIYLTLSLGAEKVQVPYLGGLSLRGARVALINVGLRLGDVNYKFDESIASDSVISQSLKAGTVAKYGEPVNLLISKGSEIDFSVPDLITKDFDQAKRIIEEMGFKLGSVVEIIDQTFENGTVIGQFPTSGERAIKNSYIDLEVVKN